jgi:hypothetical protein
MTGPEPSEVGRRLADAVPPLPEPPDRIGQVRARVRRTRLRAGAVTGAAAVLVAATLAVPSLMLGGTDRIAPAPPPLTGDGCPDRTYRPPVVGGSQEPVPAGAIEAMLCMVELDTGEVHDYRVLRTGVDQLVSAINALRTIDASGPLQCIESDLISQLSLVVRYPDGTITTVIVDGNCGISFLPEGPVWSGNVLGEFGRLYQEQVAATTPDSDTIPTPECPAGIGADRLDLGSETFGPGPETIERSIRWPHWMRLRPGQPALPYPLVAAVWCRYLLDGDQAQLAVAAPERGVLTGLRDILNDTFQPTETGEEPPSQCGRDPALRVAVPDVLLVADAVGGTAEYWVYHNLDPTGEGAVCWDTFRDPIPVAASPALVDYLLDTLGP